VLSGHVPILNAGYPVILQTLTNDTVSFIVYLQNFTRFLSTELSVSLKADAGINQLKKLKMPKTINSVMRRLEIFRLQCRNVRPFSLLF
jgi:hypothetical protein